MKRLNRQSVSFFFVASLGALLPLGYWPLVQLGQRDGVNLDVSLLYVVCVAIVSFHLPALWRHRTEFFRTPGWLLMALFTIWQLLSVFWSPNSTRGLITAGFTLLLFTAATIVMIRTPLLESRKAKLRPFAIIGLVLLFVWPVWQFIGSSLNVPLTWLLLPQMYDSSVFGVARVTGFTLEPQFLGSLLLMPLLWSLRKIITPSTTQPFIYFIFIASALLLLFTLSRGALIAAGVGALVILLATWPSLRRVGAVIGVSSISALIAIVLWWYAGTIQTNDAYDGSKTLSRITNHLSFGQISFSPPPTPAPSPQPIIQAAPTQGYVSESTESRLSMSNEAFRLWGRDQSTQLFGVGSGGIGASLAQRDVRFSNSSIVNNNYLELLAETGLIGLTLFIAAWTSVLLRLARHSQWLIFGVIIAFLVQWVFFSGSANVVHVWVVLGVAFALAKSTRVQANLLQ